MPGEIRVQGLRELSTAFGRLSAELKAELKAELAAAAEPVRARAEALATSEIRNIGPTWSRMRVGVTPGVVYVAPKSRRRRGSPRKNLAPLLMDRAMQPALEQEEPEVVGLLDAMLGRLSDENGF